MNNREEIFNTKSKNLRTFDLNSFSERKCYFEAKAGNEIHNIKNFLENGTFIVFLMAKKGAGKGTYTKLLSEIFGEETIGHISVGDVVRKCSDAMKDQSERIQLTDYLSKNYRGFIPLQEAIDIFDNRSQSKLLPTEFIITLVKREIETQKTGLTLLMVFLGELIKFLILFSLRSS